MSATSDMDALYDEAERVLRRSFELEDRYIVGGDFSEYPSELSEVLEDPYLTQSQTTFQFLKDNGLRGAPGASATYSIEPKPGVRRSGSEAALSVCLDTRSAPVVDANGTVVSEGGIYKPVYYFKHFDGKLKLFSSDAGERVEEC